MKWTLDASHSEINFTVRHMMISNVRGRFEKFDVDLTLDSDAPATSQVVATIEASSISAQGEKREEQCGHTRTRLRVSSGIGQKALDFHS